MIDASIKQAMKQARQKRKQEDKARIEAQHAWRQPAKEAAAAERREIVDAALNERMAFELKFAGFVGHVSPAKIAKRLKPKSQKPAKIKADRRYRRKNQDAINAKQRQRYAARKAARKEKESIIK
jgi:cellulase/cellobiase CelA1